MTAEGILKEEEITLTYTTWTFDPSVLPEEPEEGEDILCFPAEIEDIFGNAGYMIYARKMEIFEATKIDGKDAYISTGIHPVAFIAECVFDDEEDYYGDDEISVEDMEYGIVVPGGKVLFASDDYLMFVNDKEHFLRSVPETA